MSPGKTTGTCESQQKECEDEYNYHEKLFPGNISPNVIKSVDAYGYIMGTLDTSNVFFLLPFFF